MSSLTPIASARSDGTAAVPGADPPIVRFGIVGAGFIARWFLQAAAVVPQARVVAVTSAHPERAAAFAAEHGIDASYATQEEMLAAGRPGGATPFDVVYIGSPNSLHASQAVAALEAGSYGLVLLPSDYRGREIAGAVAATTDAGVVSGASSVSYDGGVLEIAKTALAGSWSMRIVVEGQTPVVGVASGAVDEARAASPTTPAVESLEVVLSPRAQAVAVLASTPEDTGGVSLADASTVVVGGRGVEGDFTMVKELADALGGAVGATRVACDEGWAPRGEQIGQTGLSVSPNLYVGLGVSGAVHHTVGMQSSAHIVAVCDDPDAPIFELADFGVVGDVAEVVPQALDEIRKARAAE